MSVSVSMPQLGESVTEGTVTRWLKREGDRVEADEPLLEVSTDKVDTEIPSPVSGILRGITVAEDETVAVGAELAVIDDGSAADGTADGDAGQAAQAPAEQASQDQASQDQASQDQASQDQASQDQQPGYPQQPYQQPADQRAPFQPPALRTPDAQPQSYQPPADGGPQAYQPSHYQSGVPQGQAGSGSPAFTGQPAAPGAPPADDSQPSLSGPEGPYVTPLVRKLAAEHGIDLAAVAGTGVGGRIRKQDIIDAAAARRGQAAAFGQPVQQQPYQQQPYQQQPYEQQPYEQQPPRQQPPSPSQPQPASQPVAPPPSGTWFGAPPQFTGAPAAAAARQAAAPDQAKARPAIVPSRLRGTTERMSRSRQVIAQRMVESLQTSAQLTTVVEADVTAIARLRERARAGFEASEGVKLSFLPFFALAAVEALKVHPRLNAVVDTANAQVTYHDAEHLGIAVDTERGLMVPVIRKAGDLNIAGLARKIADIAERTRAGQVSPDELSGGTFTLTNTGSRGALFDTPIINQPQVAILGTGIVVKRPVVVDHPALGEVIAVRSMVYLALTYDHRLVDGADAARFLATMKHRLEEGAFETGLGL
jgi:2-oxoglutarate dehydrogenase E2 component (dihydrolipoamide succinyltransferase)